MGGSVEVLGGRRINKKKQKKLKEEDCTIEKIIHATYNDPNRQDEKLINIKATLDNKKTE